ncbi:peroxide stress protein YaaA [Thiomicrorhabdus aquaedulcis]|uniref:peroxide stress protein YaaA n=1 Tax=Thiomicrorhabdus aquaedulcis TaxID=2211106 RepID=UPI000FD976F1|nr:peroxide stress protein YaaA [Thiomicrorhabdus aquaedulcis]
MLMLVSPAKSLDETSKVPTDCKTQAQFLEQSAQLVSKLQTLDPIEIGKLMHISENLSALNYERYQAWSWPFNTPAKQAAWLFKGDVYQGLDAYTLDDVGVDYVQNHLRILSGLYGLLKPCDEMLPYRLEMGTALVNPRGKDLYAFWGEQLTQALNEQLDEQGSKTVINLASNEYFKAIKPKQLTGQVITPIFKDFKNGQYKIISFYAKRARGLMARYAADNGIEQAEELKHFDVEGYRFSPESSSAVDWVFTRSV